MYHPDIRAHGFQYVDWLFDGEDIVAACRTAFHDGQGGARNNHDANFLTFHRFTGFRGRTMAGSVPVPELPGARWESASLLVTGGGWEQAELAEGSRAFSNRDYAWTGVSESLSGARYTRTAGGAPAVVRVRARRAAEVRLATSGPAPSGWTPEPELGFRYTDKGRTAIFVYRRSLEAEEEIILPQAGWTGSLLLFHE